jgi:hypothetical protein
MGLFAVREYTKISAGHAAAGGPLFAHSRPMGGFILV